MGAELMLAACLMPVVADNETLDAEQQQAVLRTRIDHLDDIVLEVVADFSLGIEPDEDGAWHDEVRNYLVAALALFDGQDGPDTATFVIGDRSWLFSGGMSWGDVPTDSFDPLSALEISGITEKPLRFAELHRSDPAAPTSEEG